MKKVKLLLVICAVALLSGCYKFDAKMKITEDKKVEFDVIYGTAKMSSVEDDEEKETETENDDTPLVISNNESEDLTTGEDDDLEMTTSSMDCNESAKALGAGWTGEKYSDDKFEGCKFHKTYASIDEITGDKEVVVEFAKMGSGSLDDKQLFSKSGDKYSAHFKFSMEDQTKDSKDMLTDEVKKSFELKYSVELPFKNLSNNATKVENDGKTLIWELDPTKNTDIKFSFNFTGKSESKIPWLYIGIGAGALLVIIVICMVASKGKKCECSNCNCENKVEEPKTVEPVAEPVVEENNVTEENNTENNQ